MLALSGCQESKVFTSKSGDRNPWTPAQMHVLRKTRGRSLAQASSGPLTVAAPMSKLWFNEFAKAIWDMAGHEWHEASRCLAANLARHQRGGEVRKPGTSEMQNQDTKPSGVPTKPRRLSLMVLSWSSATLTPKPKCQPYQQTVQRKAENKSRKYRPKNSVNAPASNRNSRCSFSATGSQGRRWLVILLWTCLVRMKSCLPGFLYQSSEHGTSWQYGRCHEKPAPARPVASATNKL